MYVDAHLDLAYNAVIGGRDIAQPARDQQRDLNGLIATVGLPDLRRGKVGLIFATVFCEPESPKARGYTDSDGAFAQAIAQLDYYDRLFDSRELFRFDLVGEASRLSRSDDAEIAAVILLEGADAIRSLDDVAFFKQRGIRIVGMAWEGTRYAGGTAAPGPLTPEGRELVRELDRQNILHDASHLAEQSFWDLIDLTDRPIIASHSNCRAIVGDDPRCRHLTDEMIRAIIERAGVIGINLFDRFLLPFDQHGKRRATLDDVAAHIKHICDLAGNVHHVGIGSDMDGGLGREQIPVEINSSADFPKIASELLGSFCEADVQAIMGENWRRIASSLQKQT